MKSTKILQEVTKSNKKLDEINSILTKLNQGILEKSKRYDELKTNLNKVKFKVSKVKPIIDDKGTNGIEITYSIPSIKIYFDENGEHLTNDRFTAINMLDLISLGDMSKISNEMEKAKKLSKKSD